MHFITEKVSVDREYNEALVRRLETKVVELEGAYDAIEREMADRKKAEEALRKSEKRLAEIFNFLPDATFAIDQEGTIIAWNRTMEEMTGVRAGDMLGRGNYEYALPFYGVRQPILIDLVFGVNEEIQKQHRFVKKEGDILPMEADMPVRGPFHDGIDRKHNGHAEVASHPESGTVFLIHLPAVETAAHGSSSWRTAGSREAMSGASQAAMPAVPDDNQGDGKQEECELRGAARKGTSYEGGGQIEMDRERSRRDVAGIVKGVLFCAAAAAALFAGIQKGGEGLFFGVIFAATCGLLGILNLTQGGRPARQRKG